MEIGDIVLMCFGLAFVLGGFFMMLAFQKGNRTGQDVEATILSTRKSGRGQSASYYATLQYQINGQTYTPEISTNTINQPENGSTLTIGIDPENPEKVNLRRRSKGYIVFYVIGGAVIIFAIVLAVL